MDDIELSATITERNSGKHYFVEAGGGCGVGVSTKYQCDLIYECRKCGETLRMYVTVDDYLGGIYLGEFLSGECPGIKEIGDKEDE